MITPTAFTVDIEKGKAGLWYATSPEIKGLFIGARTIPELFNAIPTALEALAAARPISTADGPARAGSKGAPGEPTSGELVRGTDSLPRPMTTAQGTKT